MGFNREKFEKFTTGMNEKSKKRWEERRIYLGLPDYVRREMIERRVRDCFADREESIIDRKEEEDFID